jgi:hypothetical protein
MKTFQALQHFYSNVPASQSPNRRGGYQTLYRSRDLTDEDIRLIEDRAQYNTGASDPIKHQFYRLPSGHFAIAQISPLAEPDEFGRKGRYLAHTLVVTPEQFGEMLGCGPFDVFDERNFRFAYTLADLPADCTPSSSIAPTATVNLSEPRWFKTALAEVAQWGRNLWQLGQLAWQAKSLVEKRESVALMGDQSDQLKTLAVAFSLCSREQVVSLSFDTHAAGCNWGREKPFWVQGFVDAPDIRPAHTVQAQARIVNANGLTELSTPYTRWMQQRWRPESDFIERQATASELSEFLINDVPPAQLRAKGVLPHFVDEFAQINAPAVMAKWQSQLPQGLSPEMSLELLSNVSRQPGQYLREWVEAGDANAYVAKWLETALFQLRTPPNKSDAQVLEKWGKTQTQTNSVSKVPLLLAAWANDKKAWLRELAKLPGSQYTQVVQQVAQWREVSMTPLDCVVPPHIARWFSLFGNQIYGSTLIEIAESLTKQGEGALDELSDIVPNLNRVAQEDLRDWLVKSSDEAPRLRAMLNAPKKKGFNLFRR